MNSLKNALALATVSIITFGNASATSPSVIPSNPLLKKSNLQYQAPRFDLIKDEHFKPAFDIALKEHDAEIQKIVNNPAAPTFENTVLAMELSGQDLNRAMSIFYKLTSANTNHTLQVIEEEYAPIFSAHFDNIYLNSKLYQRFKAIDITTLKGEDKKLTQLYIDNFNKAGAALSEEEKVKMKAINQELASLETSFSNTLLTARKNGGLLIDNVAELDGLPKEDIAAAAAKAKDAGHDGKYLLVLINTTQQPQLQYLKNRNTREK